MCISHHMTDEVGIARNKHKLYGEFGHVAKDATETQNTIAKTQAQLQIKEQTQYSGQLRRS